MDNPLAPILADAIRDLADARAEREELRAELRSYRELAYAATGQLAEALRVGRRLRETCQKQSALLREYVDAIQKQQVA